jgi:DNA-binding NarL/FixJ family response regulator
MRLVLIDDHPLVLQGFEAVIRLQDDMEVVGTASCGEAGIHIIEEHQPDISIVDLRLPGEYGLDIIKKARQAAPQCRFIVLTSFSDKADIKRAMAEKVEGYILKEALPEEILNAIRLVARNRTYLDPVIMQTLLSQDKNDPIEQLTPREIEVLEYLATGMTNRQIAAKLFVTEYTIKKHVGQILGKLGLADRTQAALYACSHGLGKLAAAFS